MTFIVILMEPWTLDELTRRVDDVLRRDHVRQDNGQVAQAPNARTVRWYQSTGLLRRPDQRGRVAYYGPAHLAELVAIKRLQAEGLSLADVEGRLRGLDDATLFELAALPADSQKLITTTHLGWLDAQPLDAQRYQVGRGTLTSLP